MLTKNECEQILSYAVGLGADFAELFMEDRDDISINYASCVDHVACIRTYGAGLYMICGTRNAYVYTNTLTVEALKRAADKAAALLTLQKRGETAPASLRLEERLYANPCHVATYPGSVGYERKIALLRDADKAGLALSPAVRSLRLTYFDRDQRVTVCNSDGLWTQDRRVTGRMRFIPVIANEQGATSFFGDYCAPLGYEMWDTGAHLLRMESAIRDGEASLSAREAPSGRVPVILEGGGCSGTFFHEACGHQLETTALQRGSCFWDKRGEMVASPKVTLIDDGTAPGMYGSSRVDDEGMPRQKNVLIENGVLKGFLVDRIGGIRLGLDRTGSGRRQDYAHAPGARMSNTYLAPGQDDEDAMLRDMDEGLYVTTIGGGTGGKEFTLMASTAYWVRRGEIICRVKGAMLSGRGDETMKKIDRVGKSLVAEEGGGSFCGADSGFIATTTSGPRMRIAEMVVGGKGGTI